MSMNEREYEAPKLAWHGERDPSREEARPEFSDDPETIERVRSHDADAPDTP